MLIDPEFDVSTKCWFWVDVNGRTYEGKTVRELLGVLRPGAFEVRNYIPLGSTIVYKQRPLEPPIEPPPLPPVVEALRVTVRNDKCHGKYVALVPKRYQDIYDEVLDLWAAGVPGTEISVRYGLKPYAVGAHIIPGARAAGDPRATVRGSRVSRNRKPD
jgi:hypothetical protein